MYNINLIVKVARLELSDACCDLSHLRSWASLRGPSLGYVGPWGRVDEVGLHEEVAPMSGAGMSLSCG